MPEKTILFFSKFKIIIGIIIPIIILFALYVCTGNFDFSKTIVLDFLAFSGFIITIFVLENTEKNKRIVNNLLKEITNQELIIVENDLKVLGKSICLSIISFEDVKKDEARYYKEILEFSISLKTYVDKYSELKKHNEVQNFYRYMNGSNIASLFLDLKVYDSYIRTIQPLYLLINSEINKNSKKRLKKVGEYN